jgi:hypothetical protein
MRFLKFRLHLNHPVLLKKKKEEEEEGEGDNCWAPLQRF